MPQSQQSSANKAPGKKPAITAHPAFPLVVAMWFAALLGLGVLILPDVLIEGAVAATGISSVVSAAAPPIGITGKLIIALIAAVSGGGLGLWLARRVAPREPEFDRSRSFAAKGKAPRKPLSAHDDLGGDGFDSVANFASSRRRALAMDDEGRRSDFLHVAPMPGVDDGHGLGHDFAQDDAEMAFNVPFGDVAPARQFDGAEFTLDEPLDLAGAEEFTESEDVGQYDRDVHEEEVMSNRQVFAPVPQAEDSVAVQQESEAEAGIEEAGEPLVFSPPSMVRQNFVADDVPPAISEDFAPTLAQGAATVAEPSNSENEGPGLLSLVGRLGAALERHREISAERAANEAAAAAQPHPLPVAPLNLGDCDMAEATDAAEAMASFFSQPVDAAEPAAPFAAAEAAPAADFSKPAAGRQMFVPVAEAVATEAADNPQPFQPFCGLGQIDSPLVDDVTDDEEEIDDLAQSLSLPLGLNAGNAAAAIPVSYDPSFDQPVAAPVHEADFAPEAEVAAGEEAEPEDESYSSLLAMKNPFHDIQPEFVRVEEPEADDPRAAVVFPHEEEAAVVPAVPDFSAPAPQPLPFVREGAANAGLDNERVLREALMNLQRFGKAS